MLPPLCSRGPTCSRINVLGLGDAAFYRRQRAAAHRGDLRQLEPLDPAERPGDAQLGPQATQHPIDDRQVGAFVGAHVGRGQRGQGGVVRPAVEAQHAQHPRAADPAANQADRDLTQPGPQRGRLAQRPQLLESRHERVLDDLLGLAATGQQACRHPQQRGGVAPVEDLAAPSIAVDRAGHQLGVRQRVRRSKRNGKAHDDTHLNGMIRQRHEMAHAVQSGFFSHTCRRMWEAGHEPFDRAGGSLPFMKPSHVWVMGLVGLLVVAVQGCGGTSVPALTGVMVDDR